MALKVWLPLNGNLENKGASNYNITAFRGSAVFNDAGKIGKCFYANGVNTLKINNIIPDFYNYTSYSLCAWIYIEAQNTVHTGSAVISGGDWNQQVINLAVSDWSTDHYTRLRISGSNWSRTYSYNFALNTWYHVIVCSDTAKTYAYVNGNLIGNSETGFLPTSISGNDICIGGATYYNGMQFFGRINDVRIYDHCLSKKEAKEISQGLVLHYKLDNHIITNWTEDGNLIPNSINMGLGSANVDSGTWRTAGTNNMTRTRVQITDSPVGTCYAFQNAGIQTASDGSCYGIDNTTYFEPNTEYRISMFARITSGTEGYAGYNIYNISAELGGSHTKIDKNYRVTPLHSDGSWTYCWYHIKTNASATRNIYIGITTGETDVTTQMCLVRIDKWDTSMQNLGIVKDSSGYNNDGLIKNPPSIIAADSPRYTTSTKFNGTSDCIYLPEFYLGNEWSYGCWINTPTSTTRGWEAVILFNNTGSDADSQLAFWVHQQENRFESLANTKYTSTISYTNYYGNWHHFFATYNGNILTTYIDGTVVNTKTITDARYNASHLTIGARCTNATATSFANWFEGQLSDVRIYATALPIEEVQKLYNTPTEIDKNGAWHTHQFTENDKNDISKTGLIEDSATSEWGLTKYLKYDPNIYFEPDGSAWVHIYHHNNPAAAVFASNNTFATSCYVDADRWFNAAQICSQLNQWEFLAKYKFTSDAVEKKERWIQSINPDTAAFADVAVANITRITGGEYTTGTYGGIYKKNSSAYWVMNNGNSGNWWGAIGAWSFHQSGIPGFGGTVTTTGYNDLYVRIDNNINITDTSEALITKNKIYIGNTLIEK